MGATIIDPLLLDIQNALPKFLVNQRWYRAKAREIASVVIHDVATAEGFLILLAAVSYTSGPSDMYLLPTTSSAHQGEFEDTIATLETEDGTAVTVYSALSERGFRDLLFHALACGASYPGLHGEFRAEPSPFFVQDCWHKLPALASSVSRAEQSNSSLMYGSENGGNRYVLKLFRKLEPGINPDIEIGQHLTRMKFAHAPAVLGALEYRNSEGLHFAAGILQEFVPNQGDAWKYTLHALGEFFQRTLGAHMPLPHLPTNNPLDLMDERIPLETAELIGPYLESAALLGRRTAEMHSALASSEAHEFIPEAFEQEDAERLQDDMVAEALIALSLIRDKQPGSPLLALEPEILARFSFLKVQPMHVQRIRIHGDYHLGQVLYTGSDFMIIDFEGEPARPMHERRMKTLALKDVAGMVRSFHYAANAALFGLVPGVAATAETLPELEAWAAVWNGWVSAAYLNAYFAEATGHSFVPASTQERRELLSAFLLQKALYELAYELNNRPGWIGIPTRGILSLVA